MFHLFLPTPYEESSSWGMSNSFLTELMMKFEQPEASFRLLSFATKYYVSKSPPICSDNLNIAYQCNETFHKFLLVLQSTILRGRTLKWCLPVRHIKLLLFYGQKIRSLVCNEMNKFCYGKHKKHRVNVVKIIDKEIWRAWTFI